MSNHVVKRRKMDRRGVAALEFTLVAPLLFLLLFGIIESGILFYQYLTLTSAVATGASQFASSAGVDATPYTDAVNIVKNGAPGLASLNVTASVNGTACGSDADCKSALTNSSATYATVQASASCAAINLVFNLFPGCTLNVQQTERVQ